MGCIISSSSAPLKQRIKALLDKSPGNEQLLRLDARVDRHIDELTREYNLQREKEEKPKAKRFRFDNF